MYSEYELQYTCAAMEITNVGLSSGTGTGSQDKFLTTTVPTSMLSGSMKVITFNCIGSLMGELSFDRITCHILNNLGALLEFEQQFVYDNGLTTFEVVAALTLVNGASVNLYVPESKQYWTLKLWYQ
jgi:hypothetical protein